MFFFPDIFQAGNSRSRTTFVPAWSWTTTTQTRVRSSWRNWRSRARDATGARSARRRPPSRPSPASEICKLWVSSKHIQYAFLFSFNDLVEFMLWPWSSYNLHLSYEVVLYQPTIFLPFVGLGILLSTMIGWLGCFITYFVSCFDPTEWCIKKKFVHRRIWSHNHLGWH